MKKQDFTVGEYWSEYRGYTNEQGTAMFLKAIEDKVRLQSDDRSYQCLVCSNMTNSFIMADNLDATAKLCFEICEGCYKEYQG